MKKITITILAIIVSTSFIFAQYAGGSGTFADPYQIATADQLSEIRNDLDKYFIQVNNIYLDYYDYAGDGKGWMPIGGAGTADYFKGHYDGQGFIISGLVINRPNTNDIGLFGLVGVANNSTEIILTNVCLHNVNVNGANGVGGLIGGIVSNDLTVIQFSYVKNGTITGNGNVGGLIGYSKSYLDNASTGDRPTIAQSFTDVEVHWSQTTSGTNFGGLVGSSRKTVIKNSYSRSSVTVDNTTASLGSVGNVGGLVGITTNRTSVSKSYSTGAIVAIGSPSITNVGGLIGFTEGNSTTTDSYWDIETSGYTTSDGGTGKTTAELNDELTFIDYDFTDIWGIDPNINDGYPYLRDGSEGLLPIKLEYFEAELYNNEVELKWKTSAEINNDYFTIERSDNGIDFTIVTTIEGAGNSSESHLYSYIDSNTLSGISYYRLKQTDFDGKFEYFDIVSITSEVAVATTNIDVYPNPSNGIFTVSTNSDDIKSYSILDSSGRIVTNGTLNSFENNIDISNMPKGVYFLKVGNDDDFSHTTRIITRGVSEYVIPDGDVFVEKPVLSTGSCVVQFDNLTGYFVDIWVDKTYMGRLNPWENSQLILPEGYADIYCRTMGGTHQWGSASEFNETFQLKLETGDVEGVESTRSDF
jgi:hypothetical protein